MGSIPQWHFIQRSFFLLTHNKTETTLVVVCAVHIVHMLKVMLKVMHLLISDTVMWADLYKLPIYAETTCRNVLTTAALSFQFSTHHIYPLTCLWAKPVTENGSGLWVWVRCTHLLFLKSINVKSNKHRL